MKEIEMARMSVPRWSVYVVVAALIASLSFSFGSLYSAFGTSHDTTYYACLYAGSLSQVGTAPPANCGRGTMINWNSEGVQGVQGPSGATNVVVRSNSPLGGNVEPGDNTAVSRNCEEGERATGGGYFTGSSQMNVFSFQPITNPDDVPTGWAATVRNTGPNPTQFILYVVCASP
jgi:hypothetical protein